MKKLLITGALGHIGSKFISTLKKNQYQKVILIDNLSTQRYCSLFNLPKKTNIEFVEKDILDSSIQKYFKGIDVVIHLAALTDATTSFHRKKEIEKINVLGSKKIISYCKDFNCKIIFPSTTSVYGTQSGLVDEFCPVKNLKPQSPYAESKLKIENLLKKYDSSQISFKILRLGTIFGISKGMRFHTAVNKFCYQASLDKEITIWKTAYNQKRPYLGINDAIKAIKFIINNNMFDNDISNVVTSNYSVKDLINIIKRYKKNPKIKFINQRIMNQLSYEVINKTLSKTNFKFQDSLDVEIKKTIELLT